MTGASAYDRMVTLQTNRLMCQSYNDVSKVLQLIVYTTILFTLHVHTRLCMLKPGKNTLILVFANTTQSLGIFKHESFCNLCLAGIQVLTQ